MLDICEKVSLPEKAVAVLEYLHDYKSARQADIAKALDMRRDAVSRIISELEAKGLLFPKPARNEIGPLTAKAQQIVQQGFLAVETPESKD